MGGFKAVEDRPTPKEVYNWKLYIEAAIIATGSFLFGYDSAFIGTTIARNSFKRDFGINAGNSNNISSNITSAFQAGALGGAVLCFFITERLGRKWTLQANVVMFIVGAILMTVATDQLSFIYAGRVLTGLGCGGITATVPSYIGELSIPSIRGILTGLFEVAYQIGSVIGFWINYGITKTLDPNLPISWRIPMAFQLVPAGILFAGCFFIHESPLWLLRQNKTEKAHKVLEGLRDLPIDHKYMQEELDMFQKKIDEERAVAAQYGTGQWAYLRGVANMLARKGMWNRLVLVFCAFALNNLSGAAAINYYSPTLFKSIGITDVSLYTGIYGLVKAIASIIYFVFLIDVLGRRWPAIVSSFVGHPADIIAAGKELSASTAAGGKAATGMIMIYSICWSFGLNGIPWIVSAEIFPGALRNFTGTYAALVVWATQFAITKALPYIFSSFGYGTWFFFASWMIVATVWAYLFLPETKGLTMDQMDVILYVILYTDYFPLSGYAYDARPEPSTKIVDEPLDDNKANSSEHTEVA
ncbi:quinate transporter [Colletotrichum navitas]|uniref:Quinate transporter n=1 Tax=Colletotrichum navitas TaxID=681940 RepID=A0AAD8V1Z4_9PEZI|nr:quinate transporter [Colletotrichum navitas]KAK1585876.1 quinate transporter [Colletotrichum navitas]